MRAIHCCASSNKLLHTAQWAKLNWFHPIVASLGNLCRLLVFLEAFVVGIDWLRCFSSDASSVSTVIYTPSKLACNVRRVCLPNLVFVSVGKQLNATECWWLPGIIDVQIHPFCMHSGKQEVDFFYIFWLRTVHTMNWTSAYMYMYMHIWSGIWYFPIHCLYYDVQTPTRFDILLGSQ